MFDCTHLAASVQADGLSGIFFFLLMAALSFALGWIAFRKWAPSASSRGEELETAIAMIIAVILSAGGTIALFGIPDSFSAWVQPYRRLPPYCFEGALAYEAAQHPAPVVAAPVQSNTCESTP